MRIAPHGSSLLISPRLNRSAGGKSRGDKREERGNQVVLQRLRGSGLVETSDELKHAIEVGSRVSIGANAFLHPLFSYADCPLASGIRQMTYCPHMTRCLSSPSGRDSFLGAAGAAPL